MKASRMPLVILDHERRIDPSARRAPPPWQAPQPSRQLTQADRRRLSRAAAFALICLLAVVAVLILATRHAGPPEGASAKEATPPALAAAHALAGEFSVLDTAAPLPRATPSR